MHAGDRTLAECFKLFDVIHRITTDHDTITRITREVVKDFAADNVRYLELRSTPKASPCHRLYLKIYNHPYIHDIHISNISCPVCSLARNMA